MKKVLLFAALGCFTVPALAQSTDDLIGTLEVIVNDYIDMDPSGTFSAGPMTFSTPEEMLAGESVSGTVTIRASRAWKYEYSATDFQHADPPNAGPGVLTTIPVGNIWTVMTDGLANVNTYNGLYIPASNSPVNMANQSTGTTGTPFTLGGKLIPGLTNQMSGSYTTTITQLASLN